MQTVYSTVTQRANVGSKVALPQPFRSQASVPVEGTFATSDHRSIRLARLESRGLGNGGGGGIRTHEGLQLFSYSLIYQVLTTMEQSEARENVHLLPTIFDSV